MPADATSFSLRSADHNRLCESAAAPGCLIDYQIATHEYNADMNNDEVHTTLFGQCWLSCTLRLTSGDSVTVAHPDYLLMPPDRNWILYVKPEGKGLQFIPTVHIAAIELQIQPVSA